MTFVSIMKLFTIIIVVLLKTVTLQSQNDLTGFYQLKQKNIDSIIVGRNITLNCDSTFIFEMQAFKFKAVGRWNRISSDRVRLKVDTVYSRGNIIKKKSKWDLSLQNNNLIDLQKIPTKRQYKRRNRKINKMFHKQGLHSGTYEDYESYKERNKNEVYEKSKTFNCQ